jgi:hypothetical protein
LARHYGSELSPRLRRLADKLSSGASDAAHVAVAAEPAEAPPARSAGAVKVKTAVLSALSALSAVIEEDDEGDADESASSESAQAETSAAEDRSEPKTSREEVLRQIDAAQDRDSILSLELDFAVERLRYVALFVVQGDVAEGLDARGDGLPAALVRRIAVPLDSPSSFRAVRERGAPVVGTLSDTGADAVVRSDLGRQEARGIALVPIHIGGRVVLIVWADHGRDPLDLAALDEVVALCGHAANAFERIIRERKARRGGPAVDASRVTVGAIARRVAEQRGVQSLRALAARPAGDVQDDAGFADTVPAKDGDEGDVLKRERDVNVARDERVAFSAVTMSKSVDRSSDAHASTGDRSVTDDGSSAPNNLASPNTTTPLIEAPMASDGQTDGPPTVDESIEVPFSTDDEDLRRMARGPEGSGRFVQGGRAPVAVDVIGPLPAPRGSLPPPAPSSDDAVNALKLVAEIVRTGALDEGVAERLVSLGERSLDAVFRYFPGPTYHDRSEPRSRVPRAAEVGPLLRLVVMFRHAAAPSLTALLDSVDPEQRYYATLCLGEVVHPVAILKLGARLFDADAPTRRIALESLRAYRKLPEFERVLRSLRSTLSDATAPVERRRLSAQALADLRDSEAIPVLLNGLADADASVRSLAHRALVVLARQDFRDDMRAWREWWEGAAGRHRIEWLIEALVHDDASIRHEAGEELKKLSGIFVGYYFNLPRRERERAQQQYREWWEREGRSRFNR